MTKLLDASDTLIKIMVRLVCYTHGFMVLWCNTFKDNGEEMALPVGH